MRWLRALLIPAAILLFAACGGDDDNGDDATAAATSDGGSAATAAATSDSGGGGGSGGGTSSGGGSGSSISSGDMNQLIEDLTPPNSSEVARFSAPDGTNVSYESSDSVDDLKSFYDDKLADLGITVTGTLTVEGNQTWIFGEDDGIGGAITVGPDGDNSLVTIIVGE